MTQAAFHDYVNLYMDNTSAIVASVPATIVFLIFIVRAMLDRLKTWLDWRPFQGFEDRAVNNLNAGLWFMFAFIVGPLVWFVVFGLCAALRAGISYLWLTK